METSRNEQAQETVLTGGKPTTSIFKSLRQSLGARILAVATALGALGASGCKEEPAYGHPDPAIIPSGPVISFVKAPDAAPSASQKAAPDAETIKLQEKIDTEYYMDMTIQNFTEVLETPAGLKGAPIAVFYMDPYKAFKIVGKAQMPMEFRKDKNTRQAFHDGQRKLIAENPENNLVRVRLNNENPERELPIVASVTPETSLEMAVFKARSKVLLPHSKKQVQLIDTFKNEIDKDFPATGLYKDLVANRLTAIRQELAEKKKEAITLQKKVAELKRKGSKNASEELKTVKADLNSVYENIINLDKERRKPTVNAQYMRDLLLYGLLPQESGYANRTSDAGAKGPWQITTTACEQVLGAKGCAAANRESIPESTSIAIRHFDYMYSQLKADITALETAIGVSDSADLLIPCMITAYTAGHDRVKAMIGWFIKNGAPAVKEKLEKGQMPEEDLFMYMSVSYFQANSYEKEKNELKDGKYGPHCLNYFPKIATWAGIMPDYVHTEDGDKLVDRAEELMGSLSGAAPAPRASASAPKSSAAEPSAPKAPADIEAPSKSKGKACGLKFDGEQEIPEKVLNSSTHKQIKDSPIGDITITGGYMEDEPTHHPKRASKAIYKDGKIKQLQAGPRNWGIDYTSADKRIVTWYGGTVVKLGREGGYGNRIHIRTNVTYRFNGKDYPVYEAFAHAAYFLDKMEVGKQVGQFENIGRMGSTGGRYGEHIDLRTYIKVNGEEIDLSLNELEKQLQGKK